MSIVVNMTEYLRYYMRNVCNHRKLVHIHFMRFFSQEHVIDPHVSSDKLFQNFYITQILNPESLINYSVLTQFVILLPKNCIFFCFNLITYDILIISIRLNIVATFNFSISWIWILETGAWKFLLKLPQLESAQEVLLQFPVNICFTVFLP